MQLCVVGTQADEMPRVPMGFGNKVDLRGAYTLSETAWIMRNSDVVIGNDCGPMHIADTVGARGFVIFGPTCLIKNGPRNKIVPLCLNRKCSPCQYTPKIEACKNPECMRELTADAVIEKIDSLLKKQQD